MVACVTADAIKLLPAALAASGCMQQNPLYAVVDQVKPQLLLAIKNGDRNGALHQISILEKLNFSKQSLEETRIGLVVNEIRKQTTQTWPDVSKRCRALIKCWQKLAEINRPTSSCGNSSNGGTPKLVSPVIRRQTSGTDINKIRITSTEFFQVSRNIDTGIKNGSYAPSLQRGTSISPYALTNSHNQKTALDFHKSASLGTALASYNIDKTQKAFYVRDQSKISPPIGIKRKADESLNPPITLTLKRSKSSSTKLGQLAVSPALNIGTAVGGSSSLVSTARKDVQSTAELIAQLVSVNLPRSMSTNLSAPLPSSSNEASLDGNYNDSVSQDSNSFSNNFSKMATISMEVDNAPQQPLTTATIKPKRKYTKRAPRFFRNGKNPEEGSKSSLQTILEHQQSGVPEMSTSNDETTRDTIYPDPFEEELITEPVEEKNAVKHVWQISSIEELQKRCSENNKVIHDRTGSFVIPVRDRNLLVLPYLDLGQQPDFLEYNYPEPDKYIA